MESLHVLISDALDYQRFKSVENEQGVKENQRRDIWNFSSYKKEYLTFFAKTLNNMIQSKILNKYSLSYQCFITIIWWTFMNLYSCMVCFTCRPTHSYWPDLQEAKGKCQAIGTDPCIQPGNGNPLSHNDLSLNFTPTQIYRGVAFSTRKYYELLNPEVCSKIILINLNESKFSFCCHKHINDLLV